MLDFIDTHSHIYAEEFDTDRAEAVSRSFQAGVRRLILPDIDATSRQAMLQLADSAPEHFFPCAGLHPTSVGASYKDDLKAVEKMLASGRRFYAIGEIGIDLYWDQTFEREQFDAFETQVRWAKELNLPVIVHIRNAIEKTIAALEPLADSRLRGVFHCFSGTPEQARQAIEMGFMLGIGGVLTYKKSDLPDIVSQIDISHLLLETDCPYLAPVPYRGKRNESSYIPLIAQKMAEIKGIDIESVAEQTTRNAELLFGLP
ncbi:MAG: TatD family hydrolase [Salinivirgaceae bacterium]|nr:TatD family hydrolase [Salinivirgaceae bacterium]